MKIAMGIIDTFQEYIYKTTSIEKTSDRDTGNAVHSSSVVRSNNSHGSYCFCAGTATRMCDSSTSADDLIAYVWHTEGKGMAMEHPKTSRADDEDESGIFPTCTSCRRRQSTRRVHSESSRSSKKKTQSSIMCDASTCTFDLSAFVWGLGGNFHMTEQDSDEGVDEGSSASLHDFSTDLGGTNIGGRSLGGGRKRHADAAALDYSSDDCSVPLRKKKKTWGIHEKELFIARTIQLR